MNTKHLLSITCILWLSPLRGMSQTDSTTLHERLVDLWEMEWEPAEATQGLEALQHPEGLEFASEELLERIDRNQGGRRPNMNDLSYEEAVNILSLNDFQYYQLQLYIETYGRLYSLHEIEAIEGFTAADRLRLAGLAVIEPPPRRHPTFRELLKGGRHVFWVRHRQVLERQDGYDTTRPKHYEGSPAHVQFRYEYAISQRAGIRFAGEKDAGEAFFRGAERRGFGHCSGSAHLDNAGWVKRAVLGDFRLNFGQGLVLGSSMMSGKGSGVDGVRRFGEGIRPVATTSESRHFRGVAATVGNTRWAGSAFAGEVTESRNAALGGAVTCRLPRFGLSGQAVCYGDYGDSAGVREKWHAMVHPRQWNAGLAYHALIRHCLLFGEAAVNEKGKLAALQAAILPVTPALRLAVLLRHYATDFQSPMGNGFRTGTNGCGEFGSYLAGHLVLSKNVEADLFADYYRLTWLSYCTDAPVQGFDAGAGLTCRLTRNSNLALRYQWRTRPSNESGDPRLHRLAEQCRHRFRLSWGNTPLPCLKTKTELNMVFNREPGKRQWRKGILLYQDFSVSLNRPNLAFALRVAYFDTDSYDERLYAYENDVYYAFTIGSYYYQGIRGYLLMRYKVQRFTLWLRLSRTRYLNRTDIGSGLTRIDKPHKTELKVQGMYRF